MRRYLTAACLMTMFSLAVRAVQRPAAAAGVVIHARR
jgi:hypothetical protein